MRRTILILSMILAPLFSHAQTQPTLQPWIEVYGTVNGEQLGKYVTGIAPATNLPYRAAISKIGSTGVYSLQVQTDTTIRQVFWGENLLTGDLNGDGHTDVVVTRSTNGWDTVVVYWGTPSGIDTLTPLSFPVKTSMTVLGLE